MTVLFFHSAAGARRPGAPAARLPFPSATTSPSDSWTQTYCDGLKSFLHQLGFFHAGSQGQADGGRKSQATIKQEPPGEEARGDREKALGPLGGRQEPPRQQERL